jgi:hypothetical protein
MSTDAAAVIPSERRRFGPTQALVVLATVLSAAALVMSLLHAGPAGQQGASGPPGKQGVQGTAGANANVSALNRCIPELTAWIGAFNVSTTNSSNSGTFWLTGAYLDTSAQQVSVGCKKVLGLK